MRTWLLLLGLTACERAEPTPAKPVPCTPVPDAPKAVDAAATHAVLDASARGKREELERFLARGPVQLTLDATAPGVQVPSRWAKDTALVLRVGRDLSPPIPDLVVDDRGVSGTLMFAGKPERCAVPWGAMRAYRLELFVDVVWEDAQPTERRPATLEP